MNPQSSPTKQTAIVVVHGVGDPRPGDILRQFTAALAAHEEQPLKLDGPVFVRDIQDHSHPSNDKRSFFPLHLAHGSLNDRRVVIGEVFWGKASTVASGAMGVLRGLFTLVFGLESMISGNQRKGQKSIPWERAAMQIARFGSELLRGPVFAINILLLGAIGWVVLIGPAVSGKLGSLESIPPAWAWLVVPLAGVFSVMIGLRTLRHIRREPFHRPVADYRWFAWCCVLFGVYWPVVGAVTGADTWQAWALVMFVPLSVAFEFVSASLLIVALMYLGTLPRGGAARRSMSARAMALATQFSLWGLVVPSLWLAILSFMGGGELIDHFRAAVPSDGAQWLIVPLPLLALGITLLNRWAAARKRVAVPRLVFSRLLLNAMVISAVGTVIAGAALEHFPQLMPYVAPSAVIQWIRNIELSAIPTIIVVIGSSFFLENVRLLLDVANDVVNYLRLNVAKDKRNAGKGEETERQRPIRGVFNGVLRYLKDEYKFDRLVIVSHSLGTVIALDELAHSNFGEREWLENLDTRLVTMGSPASHLFHHYFAVAYPAFSDDYWKELPKRLDRWVNVYRSNDFIGMKVDSNECENHDIGPGGHMGYWTDPRVIKKLHATNVF